MYKAVVFDFGNVLCSVDRFSFAENAARHSRMGPAELDSMLWGGQLERDFETGKFDSREYYRKVSALAGFGVEYDYDRFAEDYRRIIQPNPDGENGLVRANEMGYRTFVLSNTSFLHASMMMCNETLATIPELHILSYKIGCMKPDSGIWLRLLDLARLKAGDCLYIDDVEAYCEAARRLGFAAFRYDKNIHKLSHILGNMLQ